MFDVHCRYCHVQLMLCSIWEMGSKWGGCGCIQGYESECVCLIVSKSLITKTKEHPNLLLDCSHGNPTNVWEALVNVSDSWGHMGTWKHRHEVRGSPFQLVPLSPEKQSLQQVGCSWFQWETSWIWTSLIFETHWINVSTYVTLALIGYKPNFWVGKLNKPLHVIEVFLYNYTHTIHGTGIFTYMNGCFLYCKYT